MDHVRFDHIAIALEQMASAAPILVGDLGGTPAFGGHRPAYRWGQWRFAGGGRIEVMEPSGEDGFLHRFLAQRGPGIHHVTFTVPSLREACDRAKALGYTIVGYDDSNPAWAEAFLHPKEALGIVVQLAASVRSARRGEPGRWQPPPGPANPPAPVTIVGLRTRARSPERARRQWEAILGGQGTEEGDALVYRWPESPLRLVVEIAPAADEGPIAVEFASDRPVALPAERHPVLGAAFIRGAVV